MARTSKNLTYSRRKSSTPKKITSGQDGKIKKARRMKPGKAALRDIKFYQSSTMLLIRKMPFLRLVKQILSEIFPYKEPLRWQTNAITALQEVAEAYLINLFEHTNIVAQNSKRCTVMVRDMQTVRRIRNFDDIANR